MVFIASFSISFTHPNWVYDKYHTFPTHFPQLEEMKDKVVKTQHNIIYLFLKKKEREKEIANTARTWQGIGVGN